MKLTSNNIGEELHTLADSKLTNYVSSITDNIEQYKNNSDLPLLNSFLEVCMNRNLHLGTAEMYRNIGMHFFYTKQSGHAYEFMYKSLEIFRKLKKHDSVVARLSELGLIYFYDLDYGKSKNMYLNACRLLRLVTDTMSYDIRFHLYYRLGILYIYMENYALAHRTLKKAFSFSTSQTDKGDALLNIGVVYKRQGRYKKAIETYDLAIEAYGEQDTLSVSGIYNNIADAHMHMNNYNKALDSINLAFSYLETKDMQRFFVYFSTYSQIKVKQGKSKKDLDKMLYLLTIVKDFFLCRCFVVDGFQILNYIDKDDEATVSQLLQKIDQIVEDITKDDVNYKRELKECLNEVCLTLKSTSGSKLN